MSADASDAPVEVRGVSYAYQRTAALMDVSFTLRPGLTGVLGPNGAGKSTLLTIVSTALVPTAGTVLTFGQDVGDTSARASARRRIGFLPQRFDIMRSSACLRNVEYAAWAQGVDAARCRAAAVNALDQVNLADVAHRRASALSGGQRQRLGIACAIAHEPSVLVLDEPTVGLDPAQRAEVRANLLAVADDRCVLVSTHIVEDLDRIADRILVLAGGRLRFDGTRDELSDLAPVDTPRHHRLEAAYLSLTSEG